MNAPRRKKYTVLEQKFGKTIREIIVDAMDQSGSVSAAAKKLGVSQPTLSQWINQSGLQLKTILVEKAQPPYES